MPDKYKPLQKLWIPAGSGYGKSAEEVAQLRQIETSNLAYPNIAAGNAGETSLVNRSKACIEFFGIASNESAKFIPVDVSYAESFTPEWNHVSVYGRNDPLSTFQGTQRKISLQFKVNATSVEVAVANTIEISNLVSLMYPTYTNVDKELTGGNASQIEASPLLRVHFNNLILDPTGAGKSGANGMAKHVGLVCAPGDLSVTPDFEPGVLQPDPIAFPLGMFPHSPKGTQAKHDDYRIYPKVWTISTSLTIFHTFPLGFRRDKGGAANGGPNSYARSENGFGNFPWGEKHVYGPSHKRPTSPATSAAAKKKEAKKLERHKKQRKAAAAAVMKEDK